MLLPLAVALIPLVITPGLLFFYDVTPKIVLLAVAVGAALPWFSVRRLVELREGRWLCGLLGAQAGSLILSTILSARTELSLAGTNWRRFGLVTQLTLLLFTALVAADLAGYPERLRLYLRAAVAAAIPISLYGIAQYFGWDPWISKNAYHIGEGVWTIVRPPGTLGYVSYFANYLVFAVFYSAALYRMEERGWWKGAGACATVLASLAIVLSGTRAALLGLAVGAIFLWLWFGRPMQMRIGAAVAACAAALAIFYYSPAGLMLRSRTRWYQEDPQGGPRIELWLDSLRLAGRRLLVGFGPETFSLEFPRVQSAALARAYPDFYQESAHNILLDALTAQGAIGLLALVAFVGLGFYALWKAKPVPGGFFGAALAASLVSHQFSVFTMPTALYFYLTIGMLVTLTPTQARMPVPRGLNLIVLPVSALLLVLATRLVIADRALAQAQAAISAVQPKAAAEAYQRARRWGVTNDLWYSRQSLAESGQARDPITALIAWQQALESGVRATQTVEDPHNAWYHMASLYARQNDFTRTEQCLRNSIASAPNWFKPHWMLAQVLNTRQRREEALTEAELAADLNARKNPEVAQTLAQIQNSAK